MNQYYLISLVFSLVIFYLIYCINTGFTFIKLEGFYLQTLFLYGLINDTASEYIVYVFFLFFFIFLFLEYNGIIKWLLLGIFFFINTVTIQLENLINIYYLFEALSYVIIFLILITLNTKVNYQNNYIIMVFLQLTVQSTVVLYLYLIVHLILQQDTLFSFVCFHDLFFLLKTLFLVILFFKLGLAPVFYFKKQLYTYLTERALYLYFCTYWVIFNCSLGSILFYFFNQNSMFVFYFFVFTSFVLLYFFFNICIKANKWKVFFLISSGLSSWTYLLLIL